MATPKSVAKATGARGGAPPARSGIVTAATVQNRQKRLRRRSAAAAEETVAQDGARAPGKKRISFDVGADEAEEEAAAPTAEEAPRKRPRDEAGRCASDSSDSSSDDGDDGDDNLSDLSDLADASDSGDDEGGGEADGDDNPFVRAKRDGTRLSYPALRLTFLPPEFQEPQLYQFLNQFGTEVLNCFCVRSKRTHQSKGTAYVQFADPSVLPLVMEECHGMLLGGRSVGATKVTLHRTFPSKEKVAQRRKLAVVYAARGAPLRRHDLRPKRGCPAPTAAASSHGAAGEAVPRTLCDLALGQRVVAALRKYAAKEKENNALLQRHGIDYRFSGFQEQLSRVPAEYVLSKDALKKRRLDKSANRARQRMLAATQRKQNRSMQPKSAKQPVKQPKSAKQPVKQPVKQPKSAKQPVKQPKRPNASPPTSRAAKKSRPASQRK